jgi:hypothetical protein
MVLNRTELQQLAQIRIDEAGALTWLKIHW